MGLFDPAIRYGMPGCDNPTVNSRGHRSKKKIFVGRELEGLDSKRLHIRDERHMILAIRLDRSCKMNAWSAPGAYPPHRRQCGNYRERWGRLAVPDNFHLFHARHGVPDSFYAGSHRRVLNGIIIGV
jgi:hypothetical protein